MTGFRALIVRQRRAYHPLVWRALVALVVVLMSTGTPASAQAPGPSTNVYPDLRAIVLSASDMPGYTLDSNRSALQDRADGSVSYDAVYVKAAGTAGNGPTEIRLAAARTVSGKASAGALSATRDALVSAGWNVRGVPLLGDEALGVEGTGMPAGGANNAGYGYIFRFGRHLIGAMIAGPSDGIQFEQSLGYAVQMSARLDAMLALAPVTDPDPSPAGSAVASAPAPAPQPAAPPVASAPPAQPSQVSATASSTNANSIPSTRPAVSVATVVTDARLNDAPEMANGFKLGGFSGLTAPDTSGNSFFTLTDRGPNGQIKLKGKEVLAFPLPNYTPRIVKLSVDNGRVKVDGSITLKLPEGYIDEVTKTREISGLPAFQGAGEDAYSPDGRQAYGTDPAGVDTEGIALDKRDGSFWLADEYGPSILHVAADGTLLMRITPKGLGLALPGVSVRELLPEAFLRRKANRGFEGISISPDGSRVFAMLQSPLLNPDKKAGESSRHVRIVALDTSNADNPKLAGVYVYQTESASDVGAKDQDEIKIGDIAATSATRILVGERDSTEGGAHKKVYAIDLSNATNIAERDDAGGRTVEQASDSDLRKAGMTPVKKTMVVDLAKLGFSPDKFEGLAFVDSNTIAVVNDNDFGVTSIDTKGNVVQSGPPPRLVIIRVPETLQ